MHEPPLSLLPRPPIVEAFSPTRTEPDRTVKDVTENARKVAFIRSATEADIVTLDFDEEE
jgi:hypothetical protein